MLSHGNTLIVSITMKKFMRLLPLLSLLILNELGVAETDTHSALRYWQPPFQKTTLTGSYASIIPREKGLEIWREANPSPTHPWRRLIFQSAPTLEQRSEPQIVLDASIIDDVFDPEQPRKHSPTLVCLLVAQ